MGGGANLLTQCQEEKGLACLLPLVGGGGGQKGRSSYSLLV